MLEFLLCDRDDVYEETIVPKSVHVELLHNQVSFAELTFDDDALKILPAGARIHVRVNGGLELAGPVMHQAGTGPIGDRTLKVEDDFRLMRNLMWPNPDKPIGSQTSEYKRYTGPTETIVKNACRDMSAMNGFGWTVAPTTGAGTAQRVEFRFHPLIDKLTPLVDADHLTWSLRSGVVDVIPSPTFAQTISFDSGVIGDYEWSITAPTATSVAVGGEGEGAARLWQLFTDAARQSDWFFAQVMKDSRMAQGITDLSPDGAEALAEGDVKVSVSADLAETDWFRFGDQYKVGHRLPIQIPGFDEPMTETITQVVIDDTPTAGLTITPHMGPIVGDSSSQIARQIAKLNAASRDQRSSR